MASNCKKYQIIIVANMLFAFKKPPKGNYKSWCLRICVKLSGPNMDGGIPIPINIWIEMQGDAGIASSASSTFGDSELSFFGLFSWKLNEWSFSTRMGLGKGTGLWPSWGIHIKLQPSILRCYVGCREGTGYGYGKFQKICGNILNNMWIRTYA